MRTEQITIGRIPAILWGEPSQQLYIHVHGKLSCKEYAEDFAEIAQHKGYQTLSFDLPEHGARKHAEGRCDIWNGMQDLDAVADYAFASRREISLFACSIGAYFSLHTYAQRNFKKCLFQSPVVDMAYLIRQMFLWFDVTEDRLRTEQEIPTPVDTLRWDYYQYVKEHVTGKWPIPTAILYGGKDNLQSQQVIEGFAKMNGCKLKISPSSDHPFMAETDIKTVQAWLEDNI